MKVIHNFREYDIPDSKMMTGKICHIGELTCTNRDLEDGLHLGFTIGKGKTMYWCMLWHGRTTGNVTVFNRDTFARRYLSGDAEITVYFK